jgi:hypothetical protein
MGQNTIPLVLGSRQRRARKYMTPRDSGRYGYRPDQWCRRVGAAGLSKNPLVWLLSILGAVACSSSETPTTTERYQPLIPPGSYTTNFSDTENPLSEGGSWIDGGDTGLNWNNVQKSGFAYATTFATTTDDDIAVLNTAFAGKQYVQGTVKRDVGYSPSNSHEIELLLHFAISANVARGYELSWSYAGNIQIVRWNGALGDFTVLNTLTVAAPSDGDVLRGEIDNSGVIMVYLNGVSQGSATDTTWTDGQPGIGFFPRTGATLTALGWKSFTGGSL